MANCRWHVFIYFKLRGKLYRQKTSTNRSKITVLNTVQIRTRHPEQRNKRTVTSEMEHMDYRVEQPSYEKSYLTVLLELVYNTDWLDQFMD